MISFIKYYINIVCRGSKYISNSKKFSKSLAYIIALNFFVLATGDICVVFVFLGKALAIYLTSTFIINTSDVTLPSDGWIGTVFAIIFMHIIATIYTIVYCTISYFNKRKNISSKNPIIPTQQNESTNGMPQQNVLPPLKCRFLFQIQVKTERKNQESTDI